MRRSPFTSSRAGLALLSLGVALASPLTASAQAAPPGFTLGERVQVEGGITVSVEELLRQDKAYTFLQEMVRTIRNFGAEGDAMSHRKVANPDALPGGQYPYVPGQEGKKLTLNPAAPQRVGRAFDTIGFQSSVPPDTFGSIGPTQVLTVTNDRYNWRDKNGTNQLTINAGTFFGSVGGGGGDPRATYDRLTGRWFIAAFTFNAPNRLLLAVSNTSTITAQSNFTFYFVQVTNAFADYPSLGVDANGVYIGENTFNTALSAFLGTNVTVIPKAQVIGGGGGSIAGFRFNTGGSSGVGVDSPRGVDNDDPNPPFGYIVGVDLQFFGRLTLRQISWNGGVPSISGNIFVNVPATTNPLTVPTQGSTRRLSPVSDRIFHAQIWRNRKTGVRTLTAAHNIVTFADGSAQSGLGDSRNSMRWYELENLDSAPTLRQSGTAVDPALTGPLFFWMGSMAMSGQGHMALGYSSTNATTFTQVSTSGRLAGDPLGSLRSNLVERTATVGYNDFGTNPQRWGDYSGTYVDPTDDQTMWTLQMYAGSTGRWVTRAVELLAPGPCPVASVSPNVLSPGQTTNITVTGNQPNGEEYYDTDSTYPQRLEAIFNGDITVNSITFSHSNPTQIVLNVTVAGNAAAGPRNLTITNPDRQATTANGAVSIQTGGAARVNPDSVAVRLGRLDAGNAASLANVDGNALRVCRFIIPNQQVAPVTVEVNGTAPSSTASALEVVSLSRMTVNGLFSQTLDLFDWSIAGFSPVDFRTDSINTTYQTRSLNATGNVSRYIGAGNALVARYRIRQTGPAASPSWCSEHDQFVWNVTP